MALSNSQIAFIPEVNSDNEKADTWIPLAAKHTYSNEYSPSPNCRASYATGPSSPKNRSSPPKKPTSFFTVALIIRILIAMSSGLERE